MFGRQEKTVNTSPPRRKAATLADNIKTIVYAVLIAIGIRTVAFEPFNIPSGSMIPTLLIGDYLFVSKYAYGYSRYSLPFGLPLIPDGYRLLFHSPERGDVAVFKEPSDNKTDFIKRIIGLPGDRIQVTNGQLIINGEVLPRERMDDLPVRDESGRIYTVQRWIETLPGGRKHLIYKMYDTGPFNNTGVYTVPPGHYFAMGDNRDNSLDSRAPEVGFVPEVNLVGRAEFLFFSTNETASLWEIWKWPSAIRFDRLFQAVR